MIYFYSILIQKWKVESTSFSFKRSLIQLWLGPDPFASVDATVNNDFRMSRVAHAHWVDRAVFVTFADTGQVNFWVVVHKVKKVFDLRIGVVFFEIEKVFLRIKSSKTFMLQHLS